MLGKRVTLFGAILVDDGPGRANGFIDGSIRRMVDEKDGTIHYVLASVIDALPPTIRREDLKP